MTVTKQQQLEWLAKNVTDWNSAFNFVIMSVITVGVYAFPGEKVRHEITFSEWQQARDKMQKQQYNSWHERGEFPPVGGECEVFVNDKNKWMHFEVIAIRDGHVLGWCRESSCGFQSNEKSEFRPLRTEREKAIYAACVAVGGVGEDGLLIIERLYDAGMLK